MPFNKTPKLPEGAQVRIFFDGLQLLCPEVNQSSRTMDCHAYILNAREHLLSVEVSIDRGGPNFPFLRLGAEVTTGGLEIGFDKPRGVTKYVPDPANGHAKDESYDFKWAIDIQEIHQPIFVPIKVNERGVHHGRIKLNEGILYSAELTPPTTGVSLRRSDTCKDRDKIATIVAANLYFEKRNLALKWRQGGSQQQLTLPLSDADPGERYVIYVNNTRAYPPHQGQHHPNDFSHYYRAITGVPGSQEFELRFECCDGTRNTTRVPCMSAILGG